jgi:hypothetical protein
MSTKEQEQAWDPLTRLQAQRENTTRNVRSWRGQVEGIRQRGLEPPADLLAWIANGEREIDRLNAEILRVQRVEYDEGQRAARTTHADQGRRIGDALPSNQEE